VSHYYFEWFKKRKKKPKKTKRKKKSQKVQEKHHENIPNLALVIDEASFGMMKKHPGLITAAAFEEADKCVIPQLQHHCNTTVT
jgi:ribosomal protein L16/L10AE